MTSEHVSFFLNVCSSWTHVNIQLLPWVTKITFWLVFIFIILFLQTIIFLSHNPFYTILSGYLLQTQKIFSLESQALLTLVQDCWPTFIPSCPPPLHTFSSWHINSKFQLSLHKLSPECGMLHLGSVAVFCTT